MTPEFLRAAAAFGIAQDIPVLAIAELADMVRALGIPLPRGSIIVFKRKSGEEVAAMYDGEIFEVVKVLGVWSDRMFGTMEEEQITLPPEILRRIES